ncbi:hypothetical protein BDA96_02G414000 [Sorghum bicolor]|jgi:hypothetical protein|uniref:Uncharacterized protein n=1 Tax=Sorghum bicolor TaxID=4558 RepID=A0A921RSZ0_SORBI|nr:hypothetical protein BDA96_02G414000 [Sorghum bicolor]
MHIQLVKTDRRDCDWPRMPVASSPPLGQPMDGGSLKTMACAGMLMVSLVACGASMCSGVGDAPCLVEEQDVASLGGRCLVGWRWP